MDKGYVVMEALVLLIIGTYVSIVIGVPIILIIIWIKRVKKGKSKKFGLLGIITFFVTLGSLMYLPELFTMLRDYYGRK